MKLAGEVTDIIDRLEAAGHEAYAVGGAVRDALLCREPGDWDVATSASAETVTALFPHTVQIGARFGIVRVLAGERAVDVAAYRIDGPYSDHRRPDRVIFTAGIREDLARRDFTINAMAYNPSRGLFDPFDGIADLRERLIRAVGDPACRFQEDALRVLRGVRFAAQLGFAVEPATRAAMAAAAPLLSMISIERIQDEFVRILQAPYAGAGLRLCMELRLMPHLLGSGAAIETGGERQAVGRLIAGIDDIEQDWHARLALLLLCLGPAKAAAAIGRFRFDKRTEERLLHAASLTQPLEGIGGKLALKEFIAAHGYRAWAFSERLIDLLIRLGIPPCDMAAASRRRSDGRHHFIAEIERDQEPVLLDDLAIGGADLIAAGFPQGPRIGVMLKLLLSVVHEQPALNTKEQLFALANDFMKDTDGREKRHDHGRHLL